MTFELTHDRARKLAKALTARTGREIKLLEIYNDIGSLFGMNGDAMMHALKTSAGRASDTVTASGIPANLGLLTMEDFVEMLLVESGYHTNCGRLVGVIHVASFDRVRESLGEQAARLHMYDLARLVAPRAVTNTLYAYDGGNRIIMGMPMAGEDIEANLEYRMKKLLSKLVHADREAGCADDQIHEMAAGAKLIYEGRFDAAWIEQAIVDSEEQAIIQTRNRRRFSAFPPLRWSYR